MTMTTKRRRTIVKNYTFFFNKSIGSTLIVGLFVLAIAIAGCGEAENPLELEPAVISKTTVIENLAEMKRLNITPAAPSAPAGTPKVVSVSHFSDWQLTKPITGSVPAGTTIYTKVVFSEAITYKVAEDKTARPILYYTVNGQRVRYKVKPQGTNGAEFTSGNAKPKGKGATEFISKYTVQTDDPGTFKFHVGRFNTDKDGNNLAAFYTAPVKLQVGQTEHDDDHDHDHDDDYDDHDDDHDDHDDDYDDDHDDYDDDHDDDHDDDYDDDHDDDHNDDHNDDYDDDYDDDHDDYDDDHDDYDDDHDDDHDDD